MESDFREERFMLKGTVEVLSFDWKTGRGISHNRELKCPKGCDNPKHLFRFTWRDLIDKQMVEPGALLAYTAHPKGEEEQPRIKTLNQTWGI